MSLRLLLTIRNPPFHGRASARYYSCLTKNSYSRLLKRKYPLPSTLINSYISKNYESLSLSTRSRKLYSSALIKNASPGTIIPPHHPLRVNIGSLSHLSSQSGGGNRPPTKSTGGRLGMVASAGATLLAFGGKGKYLLGALKLTKFASLSSMLLTVGTYSMFFGVPYACGMVGLILVHESGHALAMMRLGIPFSPMIFVPFVGAGVAMNRAPRDAYEEALVALGGPVLGSLGAGVVGVGGYMMNSQLLFALADFGLMINLFNLLPLGFLDGGRICGAVSPYAGLVGLGMGSGLIYCDAVTNPIFYLVMMGGAWSTFSRFYYKDNIPLNYYKITGGQKVMLTGSYFGLIGALVAAMAANDKVKKSPQQLQEERRYRSVDY